MKIFTALTYYRPHTSGLTIYAERLAKAFVAEGHEVKVLTMQFDPSLPKYEVKDGIEIYRASVLARISKGCIAPFFGVRASQLAVWADVIHLHLPQFDAAGVAFRGWLLGKPVIVTYHCDLNMPPGFVSQLANIVIKTMNAITGGFCKKVITYTEDYGKNSPFISSYPDKMEVIPPPVILPETTKEEVENFLKRMPASSLDGPVIGMAARFAAEKGVDILLNALPKVFEKYPNAKVVFAGQWQDVMGEYEYLQKCLPQIEALQKAGKWLFLGILSMQEMACFYKGLDLLVVPSVNSTESFGLVQIEAMMNGVPVVASNMPGVRVSVQMTGMGSLATISDSESLGKEIVQVLERKLAGTWTGSGQELKDRFSPKAVAKRYEEIIAGLK